MAPLTDPTRLLIVEAMLEAGSPYGASSIVGAENAPPRPEDLAAARHQGRRLAVIASALVAAGEMPSRLAHD